MKIYIPVDRLPNSDSFVSNVAHTLKSMGHDVVLRPPKDSKVADQLQRVAGKIKTIFTGAYLKFWENRYIDDVKATHPDMVMCFTRGLSDQTLQTMRQLGVQYIVAWWGDSPANMIREGVASPLWDAVFLKDGFAVDRLKVVGVNAFLLHEAMNPAWHHPVNVDQNDHCVFAGNAYRVRQLLISRLAADGYQVKLYGYYLPSWITPEVRTAFQGYPVHCKQKSRVFSAALACINNMQLAEGNSLNCRAFEIAGAGGLQIMEHRPAISACFEPGREILTYKSYEELTEHLDKAQRYPREMKKIRAAAAKRARAEHTYRHRIETIFNTLGIKTN